MIKPLPPSAFLNPYSNSLINPRLIREKWLYSFWKYLLFLVFVLTYSTGFFQIQVRSGQCELNTRPIDLQSIALPTELYPGGCYRLHLSTVLFPWAMVAITSINTTRWFRSIDPRLMMHDNELLLVILICFYKSISSFHLRSKQGSNLWPRD